MDAPAIETYDAAELAALLKWYVDMGVDIAMSAAPHDRFVESAAEAQTRQSPPVPQPAPPVAASRAPAPVLAAPPAIDAAAQSAREAAARAQTLDELRAALEGFDGCALKRTASRLVFEDGARDARIMIVGEAPGGDEDRIGKPFVGRAGQLLDRMLAAIGLDRGQVYIANVVPWRPPGNRTPTPQETSICLPFIKRQIGLVNPDILICLGKPSAETLLGIREGITRARGRWMDYTIETENGHRVIRALPTLHPAYLLRTPIAKRQAWADLRAVRKALDALPQRD